MAEKLSRHLLRRSYAPIPHSRVTGSVWIDAFQIVSFVIGDIHLDIMTRRTTSPGSRIDALLRPADALDISYCVRLQLYSVVLTR